MVANFDDDPRLSSILKRDLFTARVTAEPAAIEQAHTRLPSSLPVAGLGETGEREREKAEASALRVRYDHANLTPNAASFIAVRANVNLPVGLVQKPPISCSSELDQEGQKDKSLKFTDSHSESHH